MSKTPPFPPNVKGEVLGTMFGEGLVAKLTIKMSYHVVI